MKLKWTQQFVSGVIVACLFMQAATDVIAGPRFKERAADLGITHQYLGGWEHFVGGGIAAFDCDEDVKPELFVAGGTESAILLRLPSPKTPPTP